MFVKFLIMLVSATAVNTCDEPWIIPAADACGDSGFFFRNRTKCIFADGRNKYCVGPDSGFCALRDEGNFTGMYQVECG